MKGNMIRGVLGSHRNRIAGSILIVAGLFIVCMGYLEYVGASYYGISYSLIRTLVDNLAAHISIGAFSVMVKVMFEIYTKMWLFTIVGGLCSIVGGVLIVFDKVSRGKEIAHFAEIGLASLIYALFFQCFKEEIEELLNAILGLSPVHLDIINFAYFIAWAAYISSYIGTRIAKKPTAPPTTRARSLKTPDTATTAEGEWINYRAQQASC